MGKVTITYNGAVISEAEETAPVTVRYHGSTIATLGAGESKTLSCGGKYMRSDLIIGSKTLSCGGKKMASDISLAAEADSVEDDTITYTGAMTDQIVLMSNVAYRLLTLTSSGTLTLSKSRKADVWMASGGASGDRCGGGGGYTKQISAAVLNGSMAAVVGSGGTTAGISAGKSSFAGTETNAPARDNSGIGGSGGGQGYGNPAGTGDGLSKYPFADAGGAKLRNTGVIVAGTDKPHCGGGGGGGYDDEESGRFFGGGNGGSNGSNGGDVRHGEVGGGEGGAYGGGTGGISDRYSDRDGANATFYGSAGGGYGTYIASNGKDYVGYDGNGYQGIIYVRIPLDQSIYN